MLSALLPNEGATKPWFALGGMLQAAEGLGLFLLIDSLVVVWLSRLFRLKKNFPPLSPT